MIWYEADYFKDFSCKCGACRTSCCDSWEIALTEAEFHRLSNITCSDQLFSKLQRAFKNVDNPTPERYRLFARNFIGQCPMHNENGLCSLQLELSAQTLPEICRVYPRSMHMKGGKRRAVCTAGCEAVVEILLHKDRTDIITAEDDLPVDMIAESNDSFFSSFEHFIDILHNRSISMRERILNICKAINPTFLFIENPEAGFHELMKALNELKDYSPTLSDLYDCINERYNNIEAFLSDRLEFDSSYEDGERLLENLFVNHLLYTDFPDADPRVSSNDSVYGLCMAYALTRVICMLNFRSGEEPLVDSIAAAFRYIEHSAFYYNARVTIKDPSSLTSI